MKKNSDEEIRNMISRINDYLTVHPIDGIDRMNFEIERHRYTLINNNRIFKQNTKIEHLNPDEQLAARITISYLRGLNDEEYVELLYKIGILSEEDKEFLETPYSVLKPKEGNGHRTDAMNQAQADYDDATQQYKIGNGEEKLETFGWEK